jgi:hypothetical protein
MERKMLQELKNLENTLKIKLDEGYVKLLESGTLEKYTEREIDYFDSLKNKNLKTSISTFFIPNISLSGDLLLEKDFYAPNELIKNKLIPFGMDAGGYLFCFDYKEGLIPSIVLWIRENDSNCDIAFLANSFEEFLNNLKSEDELKSV